MRKYIFLNYYSDPDLNRRKELIFCVNKNIELDFIKTIFIFVEKQEEIKDLIKLKKFKKICFIITFNLYCDKLRYFFKKFINLEKYR